MADLGRAAERLRALPRAGYRVRLVRSLARDAGEAAEEPYVSPNVVVEIISPSERNVLIAHKIAVYLSAGTELVILIDPAKRTVALHDPDVARALCDGDRIEHAALPGFSCALDELFATLSRDRHDSP